MSSDLRSFQLGLKRFSDRVPERVRDIRDAVAMEAHRGVVMMTLVDTGRARANWQVTIGDPAEGSTPDTDKSGGATLAAGAATIKAARDPFAPIWLHNGLPYIKAMNDGLRNFSRVGAVRMVEATVARIGRMFR